MKGTVAFVTCGFVERQKTLLTEAAALVGGCADTPVDVDTAGNADGKRPCLGNGQTVLTRTPTQTEFVECWSQDVCMLL